MFKVIIGTQEYLKPTPFGVADVLRRNMSSICITRIFTPNGKEIFADSFIGKGASL